MIAGRFMLRLLRCRSRFARPSPDIFWCDVYIVSPYDSIVRGVLREKNARLARRSHGSEPMMPERSMRDLTPFANQTSISRLFIAVVGYRADCFEIARLRYSCPPNEEDPLSFRLYGFAPMTWAVYCLAR